MSEKGSIQRKTERCISPAVDIYLPMMYNLKYNKTKTAKEERI
ncbi:hypothetical protein [uncultured Ruminococcus sp.]|nr:hypothetical protein [uncultured Ruminococcus sp.]